MLSSFKVRLIKAFKVDVNNRIPPTQVETVLTTPNDTLIDIPTTVNAVPIVDIPLITLLNLHLEMHLVVCYKHFYISVAFH